ncbi:DUF2892 domain-containing protein [Candidatus Falkowbacteria bacterium]|nr:DUF2892 domain-containing protein [Candidatus Falkowbacteria bacterium]
MLKQNENLTDRLLRGVLAEALFVVGYFWLAGAWQAVAYVLGAAMLITSVTGFCSLYLVMGVDTKKSFAAPRKYFITGLVAVLVVLPLAGSYASSFFSKKFFLEDFNYMNNYYKQALFNTGQEKRQESIDNYSQLVSAYAEFKDKYGKFRPVSLRRDKELTSDLIKVDNLIKDVETEVRSGDLKVAHTKLEEVRPLWQDIFKRNGYSMLAVALVDFHDSMEKMLDPASAGNAQGVQDAYADADSKLKAVEEEASDDEIKAIRKNLDQLLELAKGQANKDELAKQVAELKSSFVKVYLKRG